MPQVKPIILHDYQERVLETWVETARSGPSKLVIAATMGAGKTIIAAAISSRHLSRSGGRVVMLFDLKTLPAQTVAAFNSFGIPITYLASGENHDPSCRAVLAMAQTLSARTRYRGPIGGGLMGEDTDEQKCDRVRELLGDVTLIITDEVHAQFNRQGFRALCMAYPNAHHLGLSGTPYLRKPSQYLGQFYDGVICGPQPEQLIEDGVVLPEVAYAPSCLVESGLEVGSDGEFTIGSQEVEALKPLALERTVDAYMERAKGIPCGVYAVSVAHAELLASAFRERFRSEQYCWGWGVEVQVGETSSIDRAAQFERFNTGETRVIVSVGTMATGCDLPAMGCVIVAKSINSRALYLQIAGRGSRVLRFDHPCYPDGKKLFILITMSDRTLPRFGVPSGYQDYDIGPRAIADKTIDMTKTCPECESVILKTAPICPHCGYIFKSEPGDGIDEDLEDRPVVFSPFLSSVIKKVMKKYRAAAIAALRADTDPWAAREEFKVEAGTDFGTTWCEGLLFGQNPTEADRLTFSGYLARHCATATGRGHLYRAEFGSVREAVRSPWAYLGLDATATHDQAIAAFRTECIGVTPDRRDLLSIALGQILGQQPQRQLGGGRR